MTKYHITDEGEVKECSALSEETCKYGGEHFIDINKAYEKADKINKEKTKTFNILSQASNIEEFKQAIKEMGINYKSSKFTTRDGNILYYEEFVENSLYNAGKYFNENFKDFNGYKYNPHNKIDFDENYEDISEDLEYYIKDMLNTDNTYFENKKYGFRVICNCLIC